MGQSILQQAYENLKRRQRTSLLRPQRTESTSAETGGAKATDRVVKAVTEELLSAFKEMRSAAAAKLQAVGVDPAVREALLGAFEDVLNHAAQRCERRLSMDGKQGLAPQRNQSPGEVVPEAESPAFSSGAAQPDAEAEISSRKPQPAPVAGDSNAGLPSPTELGDSTPKDPQETEDLPSSLELPEELGDPSEQVLIELSDDSEQYEENSESNAATESEQEQTGQNSDTESEPVSHPPEPETPEEKSDQTPVTSEPASGLSVASLDDVRAIAAELKATIEEKFAELPRKVAKAVRVEMEEASNEQLRAINVSLASLNEALGVLRTRDLPRALKQALTEAWPDSELKKILEEIRSGGLRPPAGKS